MLNLYFVRSCAATAPWRWSAISTCSFHQQQQQQHRQQQQLSLLPLPITSYLLFCVVVFQGLVQHQRELGHDRIPSAPRWLVRCQKPY
jgi:L-asparagine transporter-like permease